MSLRIAILSTHPIQYQAPLFRALAKRPGVELRVYFAHDHGVKPVLDVDFGKVVRFDVDLLGGYEHEFLPNLSPYPSIYKRTGLINPRIVDVVRSGRHDALVVHGYDSFNANAVVLTPRGRSRTKIVMRGESHLFPIRSLPIRVVKEMLLRPLLARVDHFLTVGSLNADYLRMYGVPDEKMTLAPYSVDNEFFAERAAPFRRDVAAARRALGLPDDRVVFLCAGKIMPRKRPLDVLRGFARAGVEDRATLVYVGDGASTGELRAEIDRLGLARSVVLLGFRNQTELASIYASSDVLVLASEFETWGLVVNEALACGATAMVASCVGSGADLVAPEMRFDTGDIEAIARSMRRYASDPVELAAAKARSAEKIATWGIDQTADGFCRGVEAAVARR